MHHWVVYYWVDNGDEEITDDAYFGPFFELEEAREFIALHPPECHGWQYANAYCINSPIVIETGCSCND